MTENIFLYDVDDSFRLIAQQHGASREGLTKLWNMPLRWCVGMRFPLLCWARSSQGDKTLRTFARCNEQRLFPLFAKSILQTHQILF